VTPVERCSLFDVNSSSLDIDVRVADAFMVFDQLLP
jgi:hypothetical protein